MPRATEIGLWAVADGMGGHEAGMREPDPRQVARWHRRAGLVGSPTEQCEEQVFLANQKMLALSRARNGAIIGTTAAILLIREEYYACVWAGDSRIYLVADGAIGQMSRDHTEVERS